jgi:hypothetical protein
MMANFLKSKCAVAGAFLAAVISAAPVHAEDPAARAVDTALALGLSDSASVHLTDDALY